MLIFNPAPASSVVRYSNVVPSSGVLNDISPCQGYPSEANNKLWEDMYSCEPRLDSPKKFNLALLQDSSRHH